jgi:site-specific DNA recombinase
MRGPDRVKELRCAVYTRKSSEEGLEQDFNSLHAQREACEAYITSQRHEGWRVLPAAYDDGGYSGGSMDRPGLIKLLADIAAGLIDIVVVYKVDRLTRSLTDFARIVEVFDRHGVSFVSVTQSFNTTTSMGRLTLNVLLSFAQFEREVTGERIRDKIAASKKKGLWMGGWVPLGYEANGRTLKINETEASTVRAIFSLNMKHGAVSAVEIEAKRQGLTTKRYVAKTGRVVGGSPFSRGHLYKILSNSLYVGEIAHKDQVYDGQHPAIIDRATWNAVQQLLKESGHEHKVKGRARRPNLLPDLLVDERGTKLTSTHAVKNGKRYRYYVRAAEAEEGRQAWRMPVHDLEDLILNELRAFLSDEHRIVSALARWSPSPDQLDRAFAVAKGFGLRLGGSTPEMRDALLALVLRVRVYESGLVVDFRPSALLTVLVTSEGEQDIIEIRIQETLDRGGNSTKLIVPSAHRVAPQADSALIKAIARGHVWFEELASGRAQTVTEIAEQEGVTDRYVSCLMKLAFLSPSLVDRIVAGRGALNVSTKELTLNTDLPPLWPEQEAAFVETYPTEPTPVVKRSISIGALGSSSKAAFGSKDHRAAGNPLT